MSAVAFTAAGVPEGLEFQVNVHTASHQQTPSVAMAPKGNAVIAWQSLDQDGSSWGVYSRLYIIPERASSALLVTGLCWLIARRRHRS